MRRWGASNVPAKTACVNERFGVSQIAAEQAGQMSAPTFDIEYGLIARGARGVAGIDEAGRGPLAGPVAAAAVILDPERLPPGLDDSKKLSPRVREILFEAIMINARAVAIGFGSLDEIVRLNIREASLLAMRRAVQSLATPPDFALVDGNALPAGLPCPARAIVKGDATCLSIAAASIVAKVARDRAMARLHIAYPAYGFASHQGYGTRRHLVALAKHGPCDAHRATFAPVTAARQ